jgi:hypothetical protein
MRYYCAVFINTIVGRNFKCIFCKVKEASLYVILEKAKTICKEGRSVVARDVLKSKEWYKYSYVHT